MANNELNAKFTLDVNSFLDGIKKASDNAAAFAAKGAQQSEPFKKAMQEINGIVAGLGSSFSKAQSDANASFNAQKTALAELIRTGQQGTDAYKQLEAEILKSARDANSLQAAVESVNEAVRKAITPADSLGTAFTKSQQQAKSAVTEQRNALAQLIASGKQGTDEFVKVKKALHDAEAEAKKLDDALEAVNPPDISTGIEQQTKGLFSNLKSSIGGALSFTAGGLLSGGITAALGAVTSGVSAAITIGSQFESSLKAVSAITGQSGAQLESLGQSARNLAKEFGGSATDQLASFQGILSKLGPGVGDSPEALNTLAKNVNILSAASGDSAAVSMDALTGSMLQFGVNVKDPNALIQESTRFINVLAAGAKEGAAEIPQVAEAINVAGVASSGAKVSFEETNSAIQALAAGGKVGAEAGTALRNVLGKLGEGRFLPKDVQGELKNAGVEIGKLSDTTLPFTERLKELEKISGDAALMTKFFGTENSAAAAILVRSSQAQAEMTAKISGTNSAFEQAATRQDTYEASQARMKAKIEDLGISLFQTLQPALTVAGNAVSALIDGVSAGAKVISDFSSGIVSFAKNNSDVLIPALIGVSVVLGATLGPAILATVTGYAASAAAAIAAGAASVAAGAAAAIAWIAANAPLVAIGLAVAGVIFVLKKLYDNFEPFKFFVDNVVAGAVAYFGKLSTAIGIVINKVKDLLGIKPSPIKIETKVDKPIVPQPDPPPPTDAPVKPVVDEAAAKKAREDAKKAAEERAKAEKEIQEQLLKARIANIQDARQKEIALAQKSAADELVKVAEKEKVLGKIQTELRSQLQNDLNTKIAEINEKFDEAEKERRRKFIQDVAQIELDESKKALDAIKGEGAKADFERAQIRLAMLDSEAAIELSKLGDDEEAKIVLRQQYDAREIELEQQQQKALARFQAESNTDLVKRGYEISLLDLNDKYQKEIELAQGNASIIADIERRKQAELASVQENYLRQTNAAYNASLTFKESLAQAFTKTVDVEAEKQRDIERQKLRDESNDLQKEFSKQSISYADFSKQRLDIAKRRAELEEKEESLLSRSLKGIQQGALKSLTQTQNLASILQSESVSNFLQNAKDSLKSFSVIGEEGANALMTAGQSALTVIADQAQQGALTFKSAAKAVIGAAFDFLQAMVPIWSAQILGGSLATPQSILTAGGAGLAQWAALTAVLQGGVSLAKAALGFKEGGFTGNIARDAVAGVVHGQEFVHDADVTSKYRTAFEALRKGADPATAFNIVPQKVRNAVSTPAFNADALSVLAHQNAILTHQNAILEQANYQRSQYHRDNKRASQNPAFKKPTLSKLPR